MSYFCACEFVLVVLLIQITMETDFISVLGRQKERPCI